jgi:glycine betaine/proline transport system permease protein
MGLATVGGVGIVLLAIILDRITQSMGQEQRTREARHWYETGPVGAMRKIFVRKRGTS